MKSPYTNKEMTLIQEKDTLQFRKETFSFIRCAYKCEDSGELFVDNEMEAVHITQIYNQYREKHNIPFPEEIKQIREKYKLSAAKMSAVLGFGPNSYRQYENGEIPSVSNANLISAAKDPSFFKNIVLKVNDVFNEKEKDILLMRINEIISEEQYDNFKYVKKYMMGEEVADLTTGYRIPNLEKLCEMAIYFAETLSPLKTIMNKLLFYADFYNYRQTGYSISGTRYAPIKYGPVPQNFQTIFEYLLRNNCIGIELEDQGSNYYGERFYIKEGRTFNSDAFSEQELQTLKHITESLKQYSRSVEIVNLSHKEPAWIDNYDSRSIIDYSYAFNLKAV